MKVVEKRFFSKFNASGRNNKFWNITLYEDGTVEVHFGPQGKEGQRKTFSPGHVKSGKLGFDRYIAEKTGPRKGYIENKVVGATDSAKTFSHVKLAEKAIADIVKHQSPELRELITFFSKVNAHNIYDATGGQITYNEDEGMFRTTQGIVTLEQIDDARVLLDQIAKHSVNDEFDSPAFFDSVNHYLSIIPQKGLVRKLNLQEMFSAKGLRVQNDILDALQSSYASVIANQQEQGEEVDDTPIFQVELEPASDKQFRFVENFYRKSRGGHHDVTGYDVSRVFSLKILHMMNNFEQHGRTMENVWFLWHGTKASNLLSILKAGFVVPPKSSSHVTARMWGDGVYFSDMSTKSLRYATGAWKSGGNIDRKFMFVCEVAMGRYHVPRDGDSWHYRLPNGYHSCFAQAGKSGVQNNEMIVFNLGQINPILLAEFVR